MWYKELRARPRVKKGGIRLQLNVSTDYAVRIVLYLASAGEAASGAEISRAMAIPPNYLREIAKKLLRAEILRSTQGAKGGYDLAKSPGRISLRDIIESMEGTTRINRCLEPDHLCSRKATEDCPVRAFYQRIQDCLDSSFAAITVEQLISGGGAPPEGDFPTGGTEGLSKLR